MSRPSCLDCSRKHVSEAEVLMKEALYKMYNRNGTPLKIRGETIVKFDKLKRIMKAYKSHKDNKMVNLTFENELDDFDIHLRDFIGKKGMLLKDAPDNSGL